MLDILITSPGFCHVRVIIPVLILSAIWLPIWIEMVIGIIMLRPIVLISKRRRRLLRKVFDFPLQ